MAEPRLALPRKNYNVFGGGFPKEPPAPCCTRQYSTLPDQTALRVTQPNEISQSGKSSATMSCFGREYLEYSPAQRTTLPNTTIDSATIPNATAPRKNYDDYFSGESSKGSTAPCRTLPRHTTPNPTERSLARKELDLFGGGFPKEPPAPCSSTPQRTEQYLTTRGDATPCT